MTYTEHTTHLKVSEFLGKEPIRRYKMVYGFLTGMWENMECVVVSRTNSITFHKEGRWIMEQDIKNGYLWCRDEHLWSFFRDDMGMELTGIQDFINSVVEEHLNCKVGTPSGLFTGMIDAVEEHLNCKVGTPAVGLNCSPMRVEEHLNCKVGTPSEGWAGDDAEVEEHSKVMTTLGTPL